MPEPTASDIFYKVKTSTFEGPLDVLLSLIESRKLFINEISLADVTADFLSYIKQIPAYNLGDATQFLTIASTLLLIKSRSLIPNLALTTDEEEKIVDLELRLKRYQAIKEACELVRGMYGKNVIHFSPERQTVGPVFAPHESITIGTLVHALHDVFQALPKKEILPEVAVRKVIKIEEIIDDLTSRIQKALSVSFSEFAKGAVGENVQEKKVYVIVGFLAMLELVREGIIDVMQHATFDDIAISKREDEVALTEQTNGTTE
jgi:segregation and condensation protein A